jgi:hypothetical protein
MKSVKVLNRFEIAVFGALAVLVASLTLLLLNVGFQAPILV